MIYLQILNWFFYDPNFSICKALLYIRYKSFLTDAIDRSKISISNKKRLFFAVSLCPFLFFANTPFKYELDINFFVALNVSFSFAVSLRNWPVHYYKKQWKNSSQKSTGFFRIFDKSWKLLNGGYRD